MSQVAEYAYRHVPLFDVESTMNTLAEDGYIVQQATAPNNGYVAIVFKRRVASLPKADACSGCKPEHRTPPPTYGHPDRPTYERPVPEMPPELELTMKGARFEPAPEDTYGLSKTLFEQVSAELGTPVLCDSKCPSYGGKTFHRFTCPTRQ